MVHWDVGILPSHYMGFGDILEGYRSADSYVGISVLWAKDKSMEISIFHGKSKIGGGDDHSVPVLSHSDKQIQR